MRPNAQSKIHPLNNNYDSEEIAPSAHDNSHTTFPLYELNQSEPDIQIPSYPKRRMVTPINSPNPQINVFVF